MLIDKLYTIIGRTEEGFEIELDPRCDIYSGHFPGTPVTPGVCSLLIIRECASIMAGKSLQYTNIRSCRYQRLITPSGLPQATVLIKLSEDGAIQASIVHGDIEYVALRAMMA